MLDCKRREEKKIREDNRPKTSAVKINPSLQELAADLYTLHACK